MKTKPERHAVPRPKWRFAASSLIPALLGILGLTVLLYPQAASWVAQYNQSKIIRVYEQEVDNAEPTAIEQLRMAREYNDALSVGAVYYADRNVPTGAGENTNSELDYNSILRANAGGLMARLRIPAIDVDLPVYHGTSEQTLLKGAGHLEGTSLPVGGLGTRSVITAHRGLANATMFTNLNKLDIGDDFTIEVFGEVLTYKVVDTKVVEPNQTESLRAETERDLVTLVTCTPLGINSHRILVTGERVTPTPTKDIAAAGEQPAIPRFPWWAVWYVGGILLAITYVWRSGYPPRRRKRASAKRSQKKDKKTTEAAASSGAGAEDSPELDSEAAGSPTQASPEDPGWATNEPGGPENQKTTGDDRGRPTEAHPKE